MRKLLFACACGPTLTIVGTVLAASGANKVTGTVEKFDERSGRVVIDCQTFIMEPERPPGPHAAGPTQGHSLLAEYTTTLAGGRPILALEMYEHSYHIDFGAKAATYVDTFMQAIRWATADRLYGHVRTQT